MLKKLSALAVLVLGVSSVFAGPGLEGIGYDLPYNQAVARLSLGGFNHLEVGVDFQYDKVSGTTSTAEDDANLTFGASGRFLLALHQWDKFTGYLHAGLYFNDDQIHGSVANRAASLKVVVGYQPELVIFNHLAVSTLFGLQMPILPNFGIGIFGEQVSIVNGLNFRIMF